MELNNLVQEVRSVFVEVMHKQISYNPQLSGRDLVSGPLYCLCNQVPSCHFRLIFLEGLGTRDHILEDLDLMSALVFVLVCAPPQGDLQLCLWVHTLFQDYPSVPFRDNILEDLTLIHQGHVVASRGWPWSAILDNPEGTVEA